MNGNVPSFHREEECVWRFRVLSLSAILKRCTVEILGVSILSNSFGILHLPMVDLVGTKWALFDL